LKSERMVPVDPFTRDLVYRVPFLRSLDPAPPDRHLLARPGPREMLIRQLRAYRHQASVAAGIPGSIVPHQLRHT
jgi:integrase